MSGYSGTPLARKLGIEEDFMVLTVHAPVDLPELLEPLPPGVRVSSRFRSADMALVFATKVAAVSDVWSGLEFVRRKELR